MCERAINSQDLCIHGINETQENKWMLRIGMYTKVAKHTQLGVLQHTTSTQGQSPG